MTHLRLRQLRVRSHSGLNFLRFKGCRTLRGEK